MHDAESPPLKRVLRKVNQYHYAMLISYLMDNDATPHELSAEIGLHLITVQRLMWEFRKYKVAHVVGWEKDSLGRDCTQVYRFGRGKNKPRARIPASERAKKHRENKKLKLLTQALSSPLPCPA